jgi:hypothetical protein
MVCDRRLGHHPVEATARDQHVDISLLIGFGGEERSSINFAQRGQAAGRKGERVQSRCRSAVPFSCACARLWARIE